jgi:hypothetical protein
VAAARVVQAAEELGQLRLPADEGLARRVARIDRGVGGRHELERRVLAKDRALELAELTARFDPELLDERAAGRLIGVERLRLPAGAVEDEHLLPPQPLAQRMSGDQPLELTHELAVATELDVGVDPLLDRAQVQLREPADVGLREFLVCEVGKWGTPPERKRLAEQLRRGTRLG